MTANKQDVQRLHDRIDKVEDRLTKQCATITRIETKVANIVQPCEFFNNLNKGLEEHYADYKENKKLIKMSLVRTVERLIYISIVAFATYIATKK